MGQALFQVLESNKEEEVPILRDRQEIKQMLTQMLQRNEAGVGVGKCEQLLGAILDRLSGTVSGEVPLNRDLAWR